MENPLKEIIDKLKKEGYTKYSLAKKLGVSWNTLQMWYRGAYAPNEENKKKLGELLIEK